MAIADAEPFLIHGRERKERIKNSQAFGPNPEQYNVGQRVLGYQSRQGGRGARESTKTLSGLGLLDAFPSREPLDAR